MAPFRLYQACHNSSVSIASLQKATFRGQLFATFKDLENPRDYRKERAPWLLVAYNGIVWNLERLDELWPFISYLGEDVRKLALSMVGKDATLAFHSRNFDKAAECLSDLFTVALLDSEPLGCTVSTVVFWIALVVIASVVGVKFIIALLFGWGMQFLRVTKGAKMGVVRGKKNKAPEVSDETGWSLSRRNKRGKEIRRPNQGENAGGYPMSNIRRPRNDSISAHPLAPILKDLSDLQLPLTIADAELRDPSRMHVLIMVPCYSESAASIKSTLDSVADTTYPATHKSILVVADGIVHGKGNDVPTWESVIDMMELDPAFGEQDPRGGEGEDAMMLPYASLGEGDKCRNQAKVYAGWYKRDNVGNGSAGGGEQQEQQQQQEEGKSNRAKLKKSKVAAQVEDSDGDLSNGPTGTKNSKGHRVSIGPGVQADFGSSGDEAPKRHGTLRSIQSRKSGRIPMILIVKCGNEIEQQEYQAAMAEKEQHGRRSMGSKPGNSTPPPHHSSASAANMKPGNRGKRDSQILLLSFLSKLAFDDKMTELDFELFYKLWGITGVHPEHIQSVLFVDADTQIYRDSLSVLVSTMLSDDRIMGVCGETRIANPFVSWVTMIQVFEYYLSHHYEKAFESFFGTVVCLPGCFSMYRVRAKRLEKSGAPRRKQLRKGGEDGVVLVGGDSLGRGGDTLRRGHGRIGPRPRHFHVPILSSPDIVEEYAARDVSTLHKKNLLLLGEDRYLTTLMLRTFPKRKLVFSPLAVCRTVVPDKFRVLLSQRRRWINSTVHNLLELLLVRDLCGSFCLSMQFVIFMQLIGTVVLPAAVLFLLYLIVTFILARYGIANPLSGSATAASTQTLLLPFLLQFALLGLPAVLLITLGVAIRKPIYIFWMMCWLFAIPIWNFVLPLYAFWNFDDFGWGKTRSVVGENDTLKRRQRKRRKSKRDPETTASENFDATDSGEEGESVSSSDDGSTSSEEDHHDDGVPRLRHTESPIPEEEDGATTAQQASTEPSKHGKGSSISIVTPFGVSSSRRPSQPADPNEPTTTLGRRWTEWMRVRRRRAVRGGSVRVAPVAEPAWARGGANLVPVQGGDPFLVQNPPPVLVPVQPQPQPPQLLNQASMPRLVAVPHGMPPPDVPGMIAVPVVLVGTPQLGVRQGPSTSYRASYQGQAM
ncbi:chitin synthase-domain-containing protein [Cladochytrium replicatum]|nr:chitin synthase-domain-containing protein [Cladochytrium replicatum]